MGKRCKRKSSRRAGGKKTNKLVQKNATALRGGHHLYKRLGVKKYATKKQIKKAYQKLKRKKKLTKKVKKAYKILYNKNNTLNILLIDVLLIDLFVN